MKIIHAVLLLAVCTFIMTGCGPSGDSVEITQKRAVEPPAQGAMDMPSPHGMTPPPGMGGAPMPPQGKPGLAWDTPAGWKTEQPTAMRQANFTLEAHPEAQCYVSILPGTAGGMHANINRWRDQMGQPELSAGEIDGLYKVEILGGQGTFVEIAGDFTGMGGTPTKGALLYGVVLERPANTVFVKMMGPQDALEGQKDAFLGFCCSLRPTQTPEEPAATEASAQQDMSAPAGAVCPVQHGTDQASAACPVSAQTAGTCPVSHGTDGTGEAGAACCPAAKDAGESGAACCPAAKEETPAEAAPETPAEPETEAAPAAEEKPSE